VIIDAIKESPKIFQRMNKHACILYCYALSVLKLAVSILIYEIVEKQLKNEKAVKKIDIDYMTDSVIVEFDPTLITKQEIKDRLEKSGYKFVRIASAR
jgi:copper chaperone CopZ